MYEKFIKDCLLSNQSKVYSVIVNSYHQKIDDLKPTLFRKWLAQEIDVQEEKINLSSLNSALGRFKKSSEKKKQKQKPEVLINTLQSSPEVPQNFQFSSVDTQVQKSRITEI
jgi:hypothetical protein